MTIKKKKKKESMLLNWMKSTTWQCRYNINFFADLVNWLGSIWFWDRVNFTFQKKLGSPQNDLWIGLWCIKISFSSVHLSKYFLMCVLFRTWLARAAQPPVQEVYFCWKFLLTGFGMITLDWCVVVLSLTPALWTLYHVLLPCVLMLGSSRADEVKP